MELNWVEIVSSYSAGCSTGEICAKGSEGEELE